MSESRIYNFHAMMRPAEDLPDQWTAHVLELDVVTQGDSPVHAARMADEAAAMVIAEDIGAGRDPLDRRAPESFWEELYRCLRVSTPIEMGDIDEKDRACWYVFLLELATAPEDDNDRPAPPRKPVRVAWASEHASP